MTERISSSFLMPDLEREHPSAGTRRRSLFPSVSSLLWSRAHLEISEWNIFFLVESTNSLKPQLLGETLITEKPFLSRTCASESLWLCLAVKFGAVAPQNSKNLSFQGWDILVQVPDPFPRPASRNNFELCSWAWENTTQTLFLGSYITQRKAIPVVWVD